MKKIKLGGLLLALCTALAGCTIYLDIEESDKGPDDVSDVDPCQWGECVDAGGPWCPDGTWDCYYQDAGPSPDADYCDWFDCSDAGVSPDGDVWPVPDASPLPDDAGGC